MEMRDAEGNRLERLLTAESRQLIFQNHVGQRLLGSVCYRERDVLRAELGRDGRRLTVELNGGTLPFRTHHFDISTPDAATPSRTQRLHPGFLGGEPRGIAFKPGSFSIAVTDFAVGADATKKAVAEPLDAFADARNFGDVNPGTENHRSIVNF